MVWEAGSWSAGLGLWRTQSYINILLLLGAIKTRYQGSHHRRIPGGEVPVVAVVGVALVSLLGHFGLEGLAAREPGLQLGA